MPAMDAGTVDVYEQRIAEVRREVTDAVAAIHEQLDRLQRALGIVGTEQEESK